MWSFTTFNLRTRKVSVACRNFVASTIRPLRNHHYTLFDLQYLFLLALFSFCFYVIQLPLWFKAPIAISALLLLIPKVTRQFMLPFSAIASWLILFYSCRFIPAGWRPHIFTSVLPALENILYGGNISELLAQHTTPWKDILAWLPYGVFHFVFPFVSAFMIWYFGPKGALPVFARTFGYMNTAGVMTQLLFPCAPPWYETHYGSFEPATYAMPGDPGGLARVDDILGLNMYKTTFTASPLVFGAFPSLHSGIACELALFMVYVFGPRAIPLVFGYVLWIWWATMYLGHHYVVDLVGGAGYAVVAFWIGSFFLPSVLPPQPKSSYAYAGTGKVLYDVGDALDQQEKRTLVQQDHFVGASFLEKGDRHGFYQEDSDNDDEESVELAVAVLMPTEEEEEEQSLTLAAQQQQDTIEEEKEEDGTGSETGSYSGGSTSSTASSPRRHRFPRHHRFSLAHSRSFSTELSSVTVISNGEGEHAPATPKEQRRWSGWHGYENWMQVLSAVNSPISSPINSPRTSPRNSTTHIHGYVHHQHQGSTSSSSSAGASRFSRESIRSLNATVVNLDDASAPLTASPTSLTFEGAASSSNHHYHVSSSSPLPSKRSSMILPKVIE